MTWYKYCLFLQYNLLLKVRTIIVIAYHIAMILFAILLQSLNSGVLVVPKHLVGGFRHVVAGFSG